MCKNRVLCGPLHRVGGTAQTRCQRFYEKGQIQEGMQSIYSAPNSSHLNCDECDGSTLPVPTGFATCTPSPPQQHWEHFFSEKSTTNGCLYDT